MIEPRVVFDTSVVVSAVLLPRSVPRQAIDRTAREGHILLSEATFTELSEVLRRPKFERYISERERAKFLRMLLDQAEFVPVSEPVKACRDPTDDKFLEVAIAGSATHVVSGDDDLLVLKSYRGIPILAPALFLESLQPR